MCMGLKEWIQDDGSGDGMVMIVRVEEHTFEICGQYFKLEADNFKKRLRYQTGLISLTIYQISLHWPRPVFYGVWGGWKRR